ncbi:MULTISPECIES: helix-turn-helix domain-containing protein [unclassified Nocardiopsis]|uniref:helix-turn-helix domain-containing protein n=1 Tax=unclassified Nocardiopsis TaxID=2649073 RepID=UPI0018FEF1D1|nr:helix-turn-helix domain-containing protein [Nocardiopsis sp. TSRI0078]
MTGRTPEDNTSAEDLISQGMSLRTLVNQGIELPDTLSFTAARIALGLGRNKAYEAARNGEFPCPVIRIGRSWRVPTAQLARTLGLKDI